MNRALAALAVTSVLSSGCATLFNDRVTPVMVQSRSPGAQVVVDGFAVGVTPMMVPIDSSRPHVISVIGYGGQFNCVLGGTVGPLWVVLDIVFGLFPLLVDAITGAWTEIDTLCLAPV